MNDPVNYPTHYQTSKYECWDVADELFPTDPHLWQALKYLWRAGKKSGDPVEDLDKAIVYIQRAIAQRKPTPAVNVFAGISDYIKPFNVPPPPPPPLYAAKQWMCDHCHTLNMAECLTCQKCNGGRLIYEFASNNLSNQEYHRQILPDDVFTRWKELNTYIQFQMDADDENAEYAVASDETRFVTVWKDVAREAHETAVEKGWWDTPRSLPEHVALMHSELSEALEAIRKYITEDDHIPEFTGLEAEFADLIIRVMDTGIAHDLRIAEAVVAKMKYNKTRSYRHGGKAL